MTQGLLTATAKDIAPTTKQEILNGLWHGDWSYMKRELGSLMCQKISDWLTDKRSGKGGINIVIADFVEESGYIDKVLALNR